MTGGLLHRLRVPSWRDVLTAEFGERLGDVFLIGVAFILTGYAIAGRGFAYIGVPPLFIGEATLLLGVTALICCKRWKRLLMDARFWPLIVFCSWGALRTVPYFSEYQFNAVRDAVVWIYAAYALALAAVLTERPQRLAAFVLKYRSFVPWFLICLPMTFSIYRFLGATRPEWPWIAVPIVQVKEGDVLVHLSGMLAFWVSGLGKKPSWPAVAMLTTLVAVCSVVDRAGTVAFGLVFGLSFLFRPKAGVLYRVIITVVTAIAILFVTNFRLELTGGKGRDISFEQIATNLSSVLFDISLAHRSEERVRD